MKELDRHLQRRVWARVYGGTGTLLSPSQRQQLTAALQRSRKNHTIFTHLAHHAVYAEAMEHLATETGEHIKMLQQMLQR